MSIRNSLVLLLSAVFLHDLASLARPMLAFAARAPRQHDQR